MDFDAVVPHPLDEEGPPSIVINPSSPLGKELLKWEQHPGPLGRTPGNPYRYRPYPRMLYKAQRQPNGQTRCLMATPHPFDFPSIEEWNLAVMQKEHFDKQCIKVVHDESQESIARGQGWCEDPVKAMQAYDDEQTAIFTASAELAYDAKRMSDPAQREVAAAEASTHEHVTDISGPKRGRKPKVTAASGEVDE